MAKLILSERPKRLLVEESNNLPPVEELKLPLRRPRPPVPVEKPKRDRYKRDIDYRPKPEPEPKPEEPPEELKPPFFRKLKLPFRLPRPPKKSKRPSRKPLSPGKEIDYKDAKLLIQFISDQGKILSRRATRLCLRQQRLITLAIKKARILAIVPFIYTKKNFQRLKPAFFRTLKFRNLDKKPNPIIKYRSISTKKGDRNELRWSKRRFYINQKNIRKGIL